MEEPREIYILLRDCMGSKLEKNTLTFGLTTNATPIQVYKGELLRDVKQDSRSSMSRIILDAIGVDGKSLHLECGPKDINQLAIDDASLLLGISSAELRYQTFISRHRLAFGRYLHYGSQVRVEVEKKKLRGTVRYKGQLPPTLGTMFGVELTVSRLSFHSHRDDPDLDQ